MSIGSTRAICQSERMKNAPLSSIRNIIAYSDKLEQEGRSIIHLELGEPDFGTPAHIIDACKKALDNQEVHYGPIAGTVELRKALSRHCTRYGLEYAPEEILVSTGVVHGVFLSMLAYLDPGDEILVPDPGYLIYFADPHIAQAKPVSYPLREENGFQLDAETLEALITPRTKAILICSPANPCGSVLDQASLDTVAELAIRHNLLVLSDEIYADMTYDRPMPPSIASLPGMRERTIVLNGFSKYYAMTGWRIGYMLCPVKLMDPIMRLSFYNIACPTTFIQSAGIAALEGDEGPSKKAGGAERHAGLPLPQTGRRVLYFREHRRDRHGQRRLLPHDDRRGGRIHDSGPCLRHHGRRLCARVLCQFHGKPATGRYPHA